MEIIGRGFMAKNLREHGIDHPRTVILATGVATTTVTSQDDYGKDAVGLYDTLRRCRRTGERLVYLSTASGAMYGAADCPTREDDVVFPPLAYGRHKLAMEAVVARSGVEHLILRMTNLVGHNQRAHQLLPALVAQVRSGRVRVYERAHRDLLDVEHAISMIDILLARGVSGQVVNLGSGVAVPIDDIIRHIESRLGREVEREYCPQPPRTTSAAPVSLAKLTRLIPDVVTRFGLGPTYYQRVLDRYLTAPVLT
ncbi:NAD-dependent epimerase/dehydratase family protein [Amycolatopsis sp. NPDC051758]|uniref:NAD-dependent epimerase/dehydratase family protein n=1 Tax=Amycolatopsis sp. NPDC051758 TaxID=3363935 RepID=UPI0037AB9BD2